MPPWSLNTWTIIISAVAILLGIVSLVMQIIGWYRR